MALLKYFKVEKRGPPLPNPSGSLNQQLSSSAIERLHIHSNENKHKNNHGYGVKSAILLYQFQCACCDKYG